MNNNSESHFSRWIYKVGAIILFILAAMALVAFIKALGMSNRCIPQNAVTPADSMQVEILTNKVKALDRKVDSLMILSRKEPQKVYRYLKPKKDSCTIEVNIHNKSN